MFTPLNLPGTITPELLLSWAAENFRLLETALHRVGRREAYDVVWTADTTPPALGNGSLVGAYVEIGAFLVVSVELTAGSTTTFGTGTWHFSLPRAAQKDLPRWMGSGFVVDTSAGTRYSVVPRTEQNAASVLLSMDNGGDLGVAVPMAWAVNDGLRFTIGYPIE